MIAVIQALLDYGADVVAKNSNGNTPLHLAVDFSSFSYWNDPAVIAIIQVLLDYGAYIKAENYRGEMPLDIAILGSSLEIIRMLESRGSKHRNNRARKRGSSLPPHPHSPPLTNCPIRHNMELNAVTISVASKYL